MSASLFSLGIALRAALLAAIAFTVMRLLSAGQLYATACVAAAIGVLVVVDLARHIARGDRMLARFVDGLGAGDFERPVHGRGRAAGFRQLAAAIDRVAAASMARRAASQRSMDDLRTLIDNLSAALFMVDRDGIIQIANRAGHLLVADHAHRLQECPTIGAEAAGRLIDMPPGRREILRLPGGQRVLASVASISTDGAVRRVVSLENVDSELDAVELKAWQDLVRILSHEMMNSLTPIVSLASSLRPLVAQGTADAGDVDAAIEAIARRSAGLMSFVERYRRMADLPAPTLRPIACRELLVRMERLMKATTTAAHIVFAAQVQPADLEVRADPELLEQALINLLHNAIEAVSCCETPGIELRCERRGDRVAIAVADNGRGFDPRSLDRIFVPFFTTKPEGSGIGLSLARQIALAHRGQIEARANHPRGAVVTLFLPCARSG